MKEAKKIHFKIRCQDGPSGTPHWEHFQVTLKKDATVLDALTEIRAQPVSGRGEAGVPVAWESSCGFEACGSCLMVINGHVRTACGARADELGQTVVLEPLKKFPVVRDLVVDRSRIFADHKNLKDAVRIDFSDASFSDIPPNTRRPSEDARQMLSDCIQCGACLEACPRYGDSFAGAAPVLTALAFDRMDPDPKRARELLAGVADCDNARNCQKACPKDIPLIPLWSEAKRTGLKTFLKSLFS